MFNRKKFVLVGNGVQGARHAARLTEAGAQLVQIVDTAEETETFFVSGGTQKIDFALIASPAKFHADYIIQFLKSGTDVFTEKPIATTSDEVQRVNEAFLQSQNVLFPGHSERYRPEILRFKNQCLLQSEWKRNISSKSTETQIISSALAIYTPQAKLNEMHSKEKTFFVRKGHFTFLRKNLPSLRGRDVSVAFDLLVHDLDLLFFFCGCPPLHSIQIKNACMNSSESLCADLRFADVFAHFEIARDVKKMQREISFMYAGTKLYLNTEQSISRPDAFDLEHRAFFSADRENIKPLLLSAQNAVLLAEKIENMAIKNS